MAYRITNAMVGWQPIADTSTTKNHPLGTIVSATDPTYGGGEFIYLLGVASTTIGNVVTYDPGTYLTTLSAVGGSIARPVAIAMSANVASQYGWYQISGVAVCKKQCTVSLAAGAAVGVLSTGLIAGTASLKEIFGAAVATVASAKAGVVSVAVMINRPHKQGRIS